MSWIVRKTNGYFEYRWNELGLRKSKSLRTKNLVEANGLKKKYDLIFEKHIKIDSNNCMLKNHDINIRQQINLYLQNKSAEIKPVSLARYNQLASNFLTFADLNEIVAFSQLNSSIINQYIIYRNKQGISNRSIHEELALLKSVIKYAVEEEIIDKDPIRKWPRIKRIPKRPERLGSYTEEEIGKLLDYCKTNEKEFYPVFLFAAYSGCRFGELKNLKYKDIDEINGIAHIRNQKTESDSLNTFSSIRILKQVLSIVVLENSKKDSYVFPQLWQHSINWCRCVLMRVCEKLNIQYRRFHGTRHTYITTGLNAGVPTMYMQNQARHSKLSTTDRYAHSRMIPQELVEMIRYPHKLD